MSRARNIADLAARTVKDFGAQGDNIADDRAAIQAALDFARDTGTACRIPAGHYAVSDSLLVHEGVAVVVSPAARIRWTGVNLATGSGWVFQMESHTSIGCEGGEFIVECDEDNPFISAVAGFAAVDVLVTGVFGINVTQAYFEANPQGTLYDNVVTRAMVAAGDTRPRNTNINIRVSGGGCIFPGRTPTGALGGRERAGALMIWTEDWEVRDATYTGCYAAVQYWGGDSGLLNWQDMGRLGANAERKCVQGRVSNVVGRKLGAGVWGSMGRDIQVTNCRVYDVGDVGHDHEGCIDVTVTGCHAENCNNGGFASFSYSRRIVFLNCTGVSYNKAHPIYRCYNVSQLQVNEDVSIIGCAFLCTDTTGPSSVDSASGPARRITMQSCKLENVRINFNTLNNGKVVVSDCDLNFPYRSAAPFRAIEVGGLTAQGYGAPRGSVRNCEIYTAVAQPDGTVGVYVSSMDFNGFVDFVVSDCGVWLPLDSTWGGMFALHAGANGGQLGRFIFSGNRLEGPIVTSNEGAAAPGQFYARGNFNSANAEIGLTAT